MSEVNKCGDLVGGASLLSTSFHAQTVLAGVSFLNPLGCGTAREKMSTIKKQTVFSGTDTIFVEQRGAMIEKGDCSLLLEERT